MKKSGESACLKNLKGKYRIVNARIDVGCQGNLAVLTLYNGSSGYLVLAIQFQMLAIAPALSQKSTGLTNIDSLLILCDKVLEIRSNGQFTVPAIREAEKGELDEIMAQPEI